MLRHVDLSVLQALCPQTDASSLGKFLGVSTLVVGPAAGRGAWRCRGWNALTGPADGGAVGAARRGAWAREECMRWPAEGPGEVGSPERSMWMGR